MTIDIAPGAFDAEIMELIVNAVVTGLSSAGIGDATLTNKRILGER